MKKFGLIIAALLLFTLFGGLGSHGLIDPDEGRYSEIPREMLETGDFITPRLNYVKYFEKPILHYWLTAASFAVFGQNEFAARLTPALCSLGGACIVFLLARKRWGLDIGVYSAAVLSSGLLWFALGRFNITDMTLSFFITLSAAGFWMGCGDDCAGAGEVQADKRYLLLFYAGMALATLSKGLIGIVLPGGIAFWYIVLTRKWKLIIRALYWPGIVLFFILTVPWFWAVCRANEDFFYFFFVQEHFLRYTTTMHDHYEPFWYFMPILLAGTIPWTGLLPDIFLEAVKRFRKRTVSPFGSFLALWFAVPFIFFSLSGSKLVPYIAPCMPPFALSAGLILSSIAEGDRAKAKRLAVLSFIIWFLLTAGGLTYVAFLPEKQMAANIYSSIGWPLGAFLCFVCAGFYACRKRSCTAMLRVMCVLAFVTTALFAIGFDLMAERNSYKEAAAIIQAEAGPDDVVVCYGDTGQGLSFYLGKRIVLANAVGELKFGADQEQDRFWFINSEALKNLWKQPVRVFLVTDGRKMEQLADLLGKGNIIEVGRTYGDVVLSNF